MRFIIVCLLILAVMFGGHSIYYRSKTEKLLKEAVAAMPGQPKAAFEKFEPALKLNDMVALGKVGQATERFKTELERRIRLELEVAPPSADAYQHAIDAMDVLQKLERATGNSSKDQAKTIVRTASDAMPVIRDRGTLSTWQMMIKFMEHCRDNDLMPDGVIDDLNGWLAQVHRVPLRPLGLREVTEKSVNQFTYGLKSLGLEASGANGPYVLPAPDRLSNQQLIAAETAFNNAQRALQAFPRMFGEKNLPMELLALEAKLSYNKAAIKTAHIQDYGDTARRSGTGYIAELLIEPNKMVVPTPQELFGAFTGGARGDFKRAARLFSSGARISPAFRQAYAALAIMGEAHLDSAMGRNPASTLSQAKALGSKSRGKAQSITGTMLGSKRICLIVEVP